jgi:hypothetical protein
MNDDELVKAFEAGAISNEEFRHESHVRVARALAKRYGRQEGLRRLAFGIRSIATRAGHPEKYHETITRAWFDLVAGIEDVARYPELLDKRLLGRYYTAARLAAGRDRWLEPDLHPLTLPAPPARTSRKEGRHRSSPEPAMGRGSSS